MSNIIIPSIIEPSYKEGFARSADESANPELWKDISGIWIPSLGQSGNTVFDQSGNHRDAIATFAASKHFWNVINGKLSLDYPNDGWDVTPYSFAGLTKFSISAWCKRRAVNAKVYIAEASGAVDIAAQIGFFSDGNLYMGLNGGNFQFVANNTVDWVHVVFSFDASRNPDVIFYVDGVDVGFTNTGVTSVTDFSSTFVIGRRLTSGAQQTDGYIHNVITWERALKYREVQTLYRDSKAPIRLRSKRTLFNIVAEGTNDGAITLPILTVDSTAITTHGDSSVTLPLLNLNATALNHSNANLTLPILTINATTFNHSNASITLPMLTLNALGSAGGNEASVTLPILTVNSTAVTIHGDGVSTLPLLTVLATSVLGDAASITLPIFIMDNLAHLPSDGSFSLPILSVQGGSGATGNITLPIVILSANGTQETFGDSGSITLPILVLSTRVYNGSAPGCVVLNTKSFAVSEYINYGFNSMTKFNGANLIADQNGIYEQDSSDIDNNAYKIKAGIRSGIVDTTGDRAQRLRNAWLNYETDGDAKIVTFADKTVTRTYNLPFANIQDIPGIKERRIKFERGIINRYFDFKIENIDGSDIEIDKLTITLEPIVSKKR